MFMSSLLRDEEEAYQEAHEAVHEEADCGACCEARCEADCGAGLETKGDATMGLSKTWSKQASVVRRGAGQS
ncbi:hypothetical protein [Paraburkholderia solisilvae]|uniref:hypothetical protein n=1 Tax=Paraburkholderia solisilvae TaxID=624376 RepID=UPI0015817D5C|nr:hypothetical protein [Paraburkholderia solisilvae]